MELFPWWVSCLIGLFFGIFVGFVIGLCAMQKLNEYEKIANKK